MLYNKQFLIDQKTERRNEVKVLIEEVLYNRGTTSDPEDGFCQNLPVVGVWDGFSTPFSPTHPPILFYDETNGQLVRDIISETLVGAKNNSKTTIEKIAEKANAKIREAWEQFSISLNDASQLAGATFALARINSSVVEILRGGDCYAIWVKKSGEIGITHNYFRPIEFLLRKKIADLMVQTGGNRGQMWDLFYPILCELRGKNINRKEGIAILNGQTNVSSYWKKETLRVNELEHLFLFTDGFVPFSETEDEARLAGKVIELYKRAGLSDVLSWTRAIEAREAESSHQTFAEATALAIRFS